MSSTTVSPTQAQPLVRRRLGRLGLLAVIISIAADVIMRLKASVKSHRFSITSLKRHRGTSQQLIKSLVLLIAIIVVAAGWLEVKSPAVVKAVAQGPAASPTFEGPQVHPLALTPDGTRLLAVNTPNATLSIFYLLGETPVLAAEIPVGLEPVSVTVRNNREAWVTNWLSDSVSVVDLLTGSVTRTFDVGDEPTDIVFAGKQREMAFVCVSGLSQVKVFDPESPSAAPQIITIRGKQPRALSRDAAGTQVFVSVFESGNNTTAVGDDNVKLAGGLPPPAIPMSNSLPPAPITALITKWNGANWVDERGDNRWNQFLPYRLADVDLVTLDASGATVTTSREITGVGTIIGNTVFDPASNKLYAANLEAHNEIRFEPVLRGRFVDNRVSIIALNGASPQVTPVDLNTHVNFANVSGSSDERARSLALPADITRAADGTLYIAAMGSAKVGVLNASGAVIGRINVGQGPTGLALDEARRRLYVLNRFDNSISVVDVTARAQTSSTPVGFEPELDQVKRGRRFLYDATLSSHGTVSCASCHLNAHRDGLAWDLGDPQGQLQVVDNGLNAVFGPTGVAILGNGSTTSTFHPMKGPMTTQSLRGTAGTEPLHWRGDRVDLGAFNHAFVSLLGGPNELPAQDLADFQAFVASLAYPANPLQNLDRTLPNPASGPNPTRGAQVFKNDLTDGNFSCSQCHTPSPGTGTNKVIVSSIILTETQDIKVPQLRGLYQKIGMRQTAGEQLSGFGFIHDGSIDTPFNFLHSGVFTFRNDGERRDVEAFLFAFDTGTAPAVGLSLTVSTDNKSSQAVTDRLNLLIAQANVGNCDLIARGINNGNAGNWRAFVYQSGGNFQSDHAGDPLITLPTLLESVTSNAALTFTGVPVGTGRRLISAHKDLTRTATNTVLAASYQPQIALESIVSAFGVNLAASPQGVSGLPLPTTLGGTTVFVRDSSGTERAAPLFFVSPMQVNYQIPIGTLPGPASVTVISSNGLAQGTVQMNRVAPGLFTANSDGQGVPAAVAVRVKANGAQIFEPVATFDPAQNKNVPLPIDLGPEGEQVVLLLFGTGVRNRSSLSAVTITIGGVAAQIDYAGPQPDFVGLDQLNVHVPRSLAGRGEVNLVLTVDGLVANTVKLNIR